MKTCFVVMGFNRKTDYQSGRTLDLDKSYRLLIEPAVREAGLECVRADKIVHSGVTDVPMYRHLLEADLVVADLSTSNPNAMYELGVRHALRPFSTIVIAESKLQYPFNIAHTVIRSYEHLGDAIDYEEVIRFRGELVQAIAAVLQKQEKDSPVYTYLPALKPPALGGGRGGARAASPGAPAPVAVRGATPLESDGVSSPVSVSALLDQAAAAAERQDFSAARQLLAEAHAMRPEGRPWTAEDDYVVRQLAFSTFMSREPGAGSALADAQRLLGVLGPQTSNDPETVELWGRIAAAMWDDTHQPSHMEDAVAAYERRFCLRQDIEIGTTLAFLLNTRASISDPPAAIADYVQARRVREKVLRLCDAALRAERSRAAAADGEGEGIIRKYRLRAAVAEAQLGLGHAAEAKRYETEAFGLDVARTLKDQTADRLKRLSALVEQSPLRFLAVSQ